jgi:hypothetical protein
VSGSLDLNVLGHCRVNGTTSWSWCAVEMSPSMRKGVVHTCGRPLAALVGGQGSAACGKTWLVSGQGMRQWQYNNGVPAPWVSGTCPAGLSFWANQDVTKSGQPLGRRHIWDSPCCPHLWTNGSCSKGRQAHSDSSAVDRPHVWKACFQKLFLAGRHAGRISSTTVGGRRS